LRAGVPDIAALGLPRLQRIVLATLMRFAVATVRQCLGAMDAEAPIDDGRDRTAVENAICHLRVALKPHGITITTERFIGYRLSVEDKARVRELCARAA